MIFRLLCLALLLVATLPAQADLPSKERRVALVIGNSAYKVAPLKNAAKDAQDIARALREVGFEVLLATDMDQANMNDIITSFGEKLKGSKVGLFYFSGHGIQAKGKNFIIPVDAKMQSEAMIRTEAVDVDAVLDQFPNKDSALNIVILDACRNNPFESKFRSAANGLAAIDAPKGTIIAYSTAPGKVASDGEGSNGLYTQKLIKAIKTPGIPIESVFKHVRAEVSEDSGNNQVPWEASSLTGDFYFIPPQTQVVAMPTPPQIPAPPPLEKPQPERPKPQAAVKQLRDCEICPEMVLIPPGSFMIGDEEFPQKKITFAKPFYASKNEIDKEQFGLFIKETKHQTEETCMIFDGKEENLERRNWRKPGFVQGPSHPVVCVTWNDARAYTKWLAERTGKPYRLLSEAEWEYATRGAKKTPYHWGNEWSKVREYANSADISLDAIPGFSGDASIKDGFARTAPANSFKPNVYGLHNTLGNVWEWVEDCFESDYHNLSPAGGPIVQDNCRSHSYRGGAWSSNHYVVRSSQRGEGDLTYRSDSLGFRVGLDY